MYNDHPSQKIIVDWLTLIRPSPTPNDMIKDERNVLSIFRRLFVINFKIDSTLLRCHAWTRVLYLFHRSISETTGLIMLRNNFFCWALWNQLVNSENEFHLHLHSLIVNKADKPNVNTLYIRHSANSHYCKIQMCLCDIAVSIFSLLHTYLYVHTAEFIMRNIIKFILILVMSSCNFCCPSSPST